MDFSKYKFRCSSLGYIMTDTKGKSYREQYNEAVAKLSEKTTQLIGYSDTAIKGKAKAQEAIKKLNETIKYLEPLKDKLRLSDSAKTHLCDLYTVAKYGRTEDIKSKYLEKGLHMEEDAITLYSIVKKLSHKKNKEQRENDYITGHTDFPTINKRVVDTKVNWSIFQFNRVVAKPIKPLYKWQGKGYMWLWEMDWFDLAYCLLDTPDHLYKAEERKLMYELVGRSEFTSDDEKEKYAEAFKELWHLHHYKDIPDEDRVRIFEVERDKADEDKIIKYVEAAREFMNSIDQKKTDEDEEG